MIPGRGEDDGDALVTGRLRDLPKRGDPAVPGLVCGRGWVALMYARGRMDVAQLAAAVDIGRGLATEIGTASGLRAIDPSRLVVDGGNRTSPPLAPSGGTVSWVVSAPARRVAEWRAAVRAAGKAGLLRGRHDALYLDVVTVKVLMGEASPDALDRDLGVRKDRTRDAVLSALAGYAATFRLDVPKDPS
ncbi:hypothetical protein M5E06_29670 [Azospirillum sp. A1-3]|uniref:hypothetical protein n=1 Tax=Azospirillum sp. A1-3 TaxID=185874 RepID=UPI0020770189|nr:hypothetical protein [Azospirillum sp. A1-3]MCM8738300.1 hypothetical protein [Azospirillum sp. A1-3]